MSEKSQDSKFKNNTIENKDVKYKRYYQITKKSYFFSIVIKQNHISTHPQIIL